MAQPMVTLSDSQWQELETGIRIIYDLFTRGSQDVLRDGEYMKLYTLAYNHVSPPQIKDPATKRFINPIPRDRNGVQLYIIGEDLYYKVHNFLQDRCLTIALNCTSLYHEPLVSWYIHEWSRFNYSTKVLGCMLNILDSKWVKDQINVKKNKSVHEVRKLGVLMWYRYIFQPNQPNIMSAVTELFTRERTDEKINTQMVRGMIEAMVAIDDVLNLPDESLEMPNSIYTMIETHILTETEAFYVAESNRVINSNDVSNYMVWATRRLEDERLRAEMYLKPISRPKLQTCCDQALIIHHMSHLHQEFTNLLNDNRIDDLRNMYGLLDRVDGLPALQSVFQTHVEGRGRDVIAQIGEVSSDGKSYVDGLLTTYWKYKTIVSSSFGNDVNFVMAMDKACRAFVNTNSITAKTPTPELLSRYCDSLLKKSSKTPDDAEIERMLADVMIIFNVRFFFCIGGLLIFRICSTLTTRTFSKSTTSRRWPSVLSISTRRRTTLRAP